VVFCNFILSDNTLGSSWGGQGENEEEERAKEKIKLDQKKDPLWICCLRINFVSESDSMRNVVQKN